MQTALDKSPARIAGMFDAIAPRYDLLNTVLSAGLDRYWRRRAIRSLQFTGRETLLDICTGTGDVALAAVRSVVVTSPRTAETLSELMAVPEAAITVALPGTDETPVAAGSGDGVLRLLSVGSVIAR